MRTLFYFLSLITLGVLTAYGSDSTCVKVSEPKKAIEVMLYDSGFHPLKISVSDTDFKAGKHWVHYKDVQAVFIDPKQQLHKTYWLRVVVEGGKTLSFETKNEQHAIDAMNAIKCLSNN